MLRSRTFARSRAAMKPTLLGLLAVLLSGCARPARVEVAAAPPPPVERVSALILTPRTDRSETRLDHMIDVTMRFMGEPTEHAKQHGVDVAMTDTPRRVVSIRSTLRLRPERQPDGIWVARGTAPYFKQSTRPAGPVRVTATYDVTSATTSIMTTPMRIKRLNPMPIEIMGGAPFQFQVELGDGAPSASGENEIIVNAWSSDPELLWFNGPARTMPANLAIPFRPGQFKSRTIRFRTAPVETPRMVELRFNTNRELMRLSVRLTPGQTARQDELTAVPVRR